MKLEFESVDRFKDAFGVERFRAKPNLMTYRRIVGGVGFGRDVSSVVILGERINTIPEIDEHPVDVIFEDTAATAEELFTLIADDLRVRFSCLQYFGTMSGVEFVALRRVNRRLASFRRPLLSISSPLPEAEDMGVVDSMVGRRTTTRKTLLFHGATVAEIYQGLRDDELSGAFPLPEIAAFGRALAMLDLTSRPQYEAPTSGFFYA